MVKVTGLPPMRSFTSPQSNSHSCPGSYHCLTNTSFGLPDFSALRSWMYLHTLE